MSFIHQQLVAGLQLQHHGRNQEAKTIYEWVLSVDPNNFDALQLLGSLALRDGEAQQAVSFLERALKMNPRFPDVHYNLGQALSNPSLCASRRTTISGLVLPDRIEDIL